MNGPQDSGGMTSFGAVVPEANEPVFHELWEARALALGIAADAAGLWNTDIVRHVRELTPPVTYWEMNYYEIRVNSHIKLMIDRGMITEAELVSGSMQVPPRPVKGVLTAEKVPAVLAKGNPASRESNRPQLFVAGDRVRTRNQHPRGHTRLPRYASGKIGEIVSVHGTHVFPDCSALGLGEDPQWLYTVSFTAAELWGKSARDTIQLDLWEPYLEAAS